MTEDEFLSLTLPDRITWVWKHTASPEARRKHATVVEVAAMLNVAPKTFYGWKKANESNRHVPSPENAEALAELAAKANPPLKTTPDSFLVPREEAASLESIQTHLAALADEIVRLAVLIETALELLPASARPGVRSGRSRRKAG